jgi:ubiquinone biosynthesis protein Coq4
MTDARPNSPELSEALHDELMLSLRRWTVDGSVPLTHEFLRSGDAHARERYCRIQAENPVAQRLLEERYLAPVPDMDRLRALDDGTLGRAFATHVDDNGLDVHKLRESAFIEAHARDGDDQGYLAERGFQLHDLFHVLTGYDTGPLGEVGVVSFTAAQTMSPYPTFIMTTRPLQMALYEPDLLPFVMDTVAEGWIRGRTADMLVGVRWEDHWDEPLEELRRRHGLVTG